MTCFGERSDLPRIYESQTFKISVSDRARALKIQNGRHKSRNTRSKQMRELPVPKAGLQASARGKIRLTMTPH